MGWLQFGKHNSRNDCHILGHKSFLIWIIMYLLYFISFSFLVSIYIDSCTYL